MKTLLPFWLIIPLVFASPGRSQNVARMEQVIQSYVTDGRFMGSVLVVRGDQILLNKGYGAANLEWNVPNDPSTIFRLGPASPDWNLVSGLAR